MSSALLGARLLLSAGFIRSGQECRERTVGLTVRKCKRFVVAAALVAGMALEPVMDFSYKHRTNGGSSDAIMRETDGERVFLGRRTGHGASAWLLSAPGDRHVSLASDE